MVGPRFSCSTLMVQDNGLSESPKRTSGLVRAILQPWMNESFPQAPVFKELKVPYISKNSTRLWLFLLRGSRGKVWENRGINSSRASDCSPASIWLHGPLDNSWMWCPQHPCKQTGRTAHVLTPQGGTRRCKGVVPVVAGLGVGKRPPSGKLIDLERRILQAGADTPMDLIKAHTSESRDHGLRPWSQSPSEHCEPYA